MSFAARTTAALAAAALMAVLAGCSGGDGQQVDSGPGWVNRTIYAASKIEVGAGVAAVTALRQDRKLYTVVLDLANGRELWGQPATMTGRLTGLGVQPPAVVDGPEGALVVALEPADKEGKNTATLIARDARTGTEEWTRPIHSTFGPAACGSYICLSENTSRPNPRFVVLEPTTGKAIWKIPGVAEVQGATGERVVLMTMNDNPALQSRDLHSGQPQWKLPLARATSGPVNLAGGWYFAEVGNSIIGYVGPYRESAEAAPSGYGYFAVNARDGKLLWKQQVARLYPKPKPSSLLLTRQGAPGNWRGFVRLDPKTGRTTAEVPPDRVPNFRYWLGFSTDLKTLGFLPAERRPGKAFDLNTGRPVDVDGRTVWSFCSRNPRPLPIVGHEGFYASAAVCEFNLADGTQLRSDQVPPKWVTGATNGWRVWRDESGAVHGIKDDSGTSPGMYG